MFDSLLKPSVVDVPAEVKLAEEILMTCWSFFAGAVLFPSPVKDPPKMTVPLVLLTMELTGPLNPSNGRLAQPDEPTQMMALVELEALNCPPT